MMSLFIAHYFTTPVASHCIGFAFHELPYFDLSLQNNFIMVNSCHTLIDYYYFCSIERHFVNRFHRLRDENLAETVHLIFQRAIRPLDFPNIKPVLLNDGYQSPTSTSPCVLTSLRSFGRDSK